MKKYHVVLSKEAHIDARRLLHYISTVYKSPLTAIRYMAGVDKAIQKLSVYAGSIAVIRNDFIQSLYGPDARRINYKKVAIIFVIRGNTVCIKRVMAASLIR
jgi:hypothetical protein